MNVLEIISDMIYIFCVQIKVLLMAVKDFNPDSGDPAYTMGIVDLLLECVELSYRPGKWLIRFLLDLLKSICWHRASVYCSYASPNNPLFLWLCIPNSCSLDSDT